MPRGFTGHVRHPQKDHLIALSHARHAARILHMLAVMSVPEVYDSRALNIIGPIKNQKQCGSCWNFSGVFMVEVAFYLAKLLKSDGSQALSEEYVLSCQRNGGCNGDDNVTVLDIAKSTGLPLTSDYGPYTASPGRCNWKAGMSLFKIDDYAFCDPNQQGQTIASTLSIQTAIMLHGGVGCAVAAGGDQFWNTGQGIGTGRSNQIDHDVGLVGWITKNNKVIWIMRNSWDVSWGDKCANDANPSPAEAGYAFVQEGAYSIGTEAVYALKTNPNPPPPPTPPDWTP